MRVTHPFRLVLLISGLLIPALHAVADEPEFRPEGKVIGRIWHTKVKFHESFDFLQKVREELEIPQSPVLMVMQPRGFNPGPGALTGAEEVELRGTLVFLQTRPTISLSETISFELVGDQAAFEAYVRQQMAGMGLAAELLGEGDRLEVKLDFSRLMTAPPQLAEEPEGSDDAPKGERRQRTQSFALAITAEVSGTSSDGKGGPPQMPSSISTYYRYVDGLVYSSRSSAVHLVDLPGRESLKLIESEAANDIFADFDFSTIPSDLKRAFWSSVESQASVWLQRFDQEAAGDYSLRRAIAESRLELIKSVLFDVDRAWLTLNLSPDGTKPVTARARIQARENSMLAAALSEMSATRSGMALLQDDESPLVISGTIRVPESLQPFASALASSTGLKLQEALADIPAATVLVEDLVRPLQETAIAGLIDAAFCLRGTVETGLVPCGGLRLENAETFLAALEPLLQVASTSGRLSVSAEERGDHRCVSVRTDVTDRPGAEEPLPVQINLAASGSRLWFTVGGEPALETLDDLLAAEPATTSAGDAAPFLIRFRLNKWLGSGHDELSRMPGQMLTALEKEIGRRTTPRMTISINGATPETNAADGAEEFTSYAGKVFQPDTSELELKVRTADREMVVDATVGTGLVKFAVAQFLDAQSRMFKGLSLQFGGPGVPGLPGDSGDGKVEIRQGGSFNIQLGRPKSE